MRRRIGLEVPLNHRYPGGTGAWLQYLRKNKMLKAFDEKNIASYPEGTLLVRPYSNFSDQGHVAVLLNDGNVIHCFPMNPIPAPGFHEPGVTITHVLPNYYKFQCPPNIWLSVPTAPTAPKRRTRQRQRQRSKRNI